MKPKVLIVEDEADLSSVVDKYLRAAHFQTQVIDSGLEVTEWVKNHTPDFVLLDLMLPGKDGLTLCKEIRSFSEVPIIIMTAKVEEVDRLIGLETGADDYVCKPFSVRELVARVKVIMRRLGQAADKSPGKTLLTVDKDKMQVFYHGQQLVLTAIEFHLFNLLYSHSGRIYSRQQIIEQVYTDFREISERTVDSHIRNLRKKIAQLGLHQEVIHSIYGVGYKFEPPAS